MNCMYACRQYNCVHVDNKTTQSVNDSNIEWIINECAAAFWLVVFLLYVVYVARYVKHDLVD